MDPAFFSAADLFHQEDSDEDRTVVGEISSNYVERTHSFPGMVLPIREFSFHQLNANLLWPGALIFAQWLVEHKDLLQHRRTLELGSGTGALAIFLKKAFAMDITTSDYDDEEIEKNIAYNCKVNEIPPLQHIRHTWGDEFPVREPDWDLIIASDILLYVKEYNNLIKTILFLLQNYAHRGIGAVENHGTVNDVEQNLSKSNNMYQSSSDDLVFHSEQKDFPLQGHMITQAKGYEAGCQAQDYTELPKPSFLMSWRRRIPKEEESLFFDGCKAAGLSVCHLGSRIYCLNL